MSKIFLCLLLCALLIVVAAPASAQLSTGGVPCVLGTTVWVANSLGSSQTGTFTASFDATPQADASDVNVALSQNVPAAYTDLAAIVRFNPSGNIVVRNGATYAADYIQPYSANSTYHFAVVVNVSAHTYTVYVTPPGSTQQTLASDYAFRTTQSSVSSLDYWTTYQNPLSIAPLQVCNFSLGTDPAAPPTFSTIWSASTVPTLVDAGADSAVELGVNFKADVNGTISGIRFYKSSANTGTHVGNLWSSTGTLLASAMFVSETASGWQQVNFASPVAITANTVYVASYHTNVGHYSDDQNYFLTAGVDNPPLHALQDGVSGADGVAAYGSSSTFPNSGWNSSNYWVDVAFTPSAALTSITVTPANPTVTADGTQQFTATVTGTTNTAVTWSVASGGGTISSSGLYTAPSTAGTATIMATSVADPTWSAVANVTVISPTTMLLSASPNSIAFGSVVVGASASNMVTLTNTGNSAVTVWSATTTGSGFSLTGLTFPFTLASAASKAATVVFAPTISGMATGSVSFVSDASNSPATVALSGSGTAPQPHTATLNWQASTTAVSGYNVYRSATSGSGYARLNSVLTPGSNYVDFAVVAGQTYYYVVTAVDTTDLESEYSNQVTAVIPTP